MSIRRIVSLTALLSFFVILLTSIILYIMPHGRVAYWADWQLWGLSKDQWAAIHINTGVLFLLAMALHIFYNWNPILLYLRNKTRQLKVFTREFNAALILLLVCLLGTYGEMPPFSTILNISESIKEAASIKYGEPPYGHAELSTLAAFAKKMDLDAAASIESIKKAGFIIESKDQTLKEIANLNNVPPQQIYLAMTPMAKPTSTDSGRVQTLPENPPSGTGNLTLADFCSQHNLDIKAVLAALKDAGITAEEEMTIKKIGEANQMSPIDVYGTIREVAVSNLQ